MAEALALSTPRSQSELLQVVNGALSDRMGIFAVGGQTKRTWGPWPSPEAALPAITICTLGLDEIVAYEPQDMVITVQAGLKLSQLQSRLAAHGQWLPVDPPHAEGTVGGLLATGAWGPRRLGHGTVKDHLLGMHVLGPRGVITKSGGRVVKNVAGFDLHRLHVGALGSLGVIVEATFKVSTRPAASAALLVPFSHRSEAHKWLLSLHASPLRPTALEFFTAEEADALARADAEVPLANAVAVVGVDGSEAFVERHRAELHARLPAGVAARWRDDSASLWAAVAGLWDRRAGRAVVRLAAKPHDLPTLITDEAPDLGVQVSVGLGVCRVIASAREPVDEIVTRTRARHARAAAVGGYVVVESAPRDWPARTNLPFTLAHHSPPSPTQRLYASLKNTWDPLQLMHPGRTPA